MEEDFLQLNQDKTEVLVIGAEAQREKLSAHQHLLAINPSRIPSSQLQKRI